MTFWLWPGIRTWIRLKAKTKIEGFQNQWQSLKCGVLQMPLQLEEDPWQLQQEHTHQCTAHWYLLKYVWMCRGISFIKAGRYSKCLAKSIHDKRNTYHVSHLVKTLVHDNTHWAKSKWRRWEAKQAWFSQFLVLFWLWSTILMGWVRRKLD